jgi:hypothetical protein
MIGEIDIYGVFISPMLAWGVLALALHTALRAGLARIGFHRVVWHAPLADLALFFIVLGSMALLLPDWIGS